MNTIAVVFEGRSGSSYHRQLTPHAHLSQMYKDEFKVIFFDTFEEITEEQLKEIQLIQFHRLFGVNEVEEQRITDLKSKGIVVVLDQDDYWHVPKEIITAYTTYEYFGLTKKIERCLELADHVTTTTDFLENRIYEKTTAKVTVIPNSIHQDIPQFRPKRKVFDENFIKFGWVGGVSHVSDIVSMSESFKRLHKDKENWRRWQLVLGGFDMSKENRTVMRIQKNGTLKPEMIKQYETMYGIMERIFTDEYRVLRGKEYEEYLKFLGKFARETFNPNEKLPYRRIWAREVTKYMEIYDEMDVVFIPMKNIEFNNCKSQLKMIEAGFFGKAVIVSDAYPYTIDAVDDENCLTVKSGEEYIGFYTAMRKLLNDPGEVQRLGRNLRNHVIEKYNMDKVNKIRYELYKELIRKKNA